MRLLVDNIATLAGIDSGATLKKCGAEMARFDTIHDAWMLVEDGIITEFDTAENHPAPERVDIIADARRGTVMPSWCDSHTHIVYADSREREFVDKINGLSYAEIARCGGGILNSARRLHELTEQQLYEQAMERVREVIDKGTGAIEIKSGYGLNTADELKMLRVTARIQQDTRLRVVSTFLGAHAVPPEYAGRQSDYVDLIVNEMIPAVAAEGLADYVDVFCDQGFFTPEETARILEAGASLRNEGQDTRTRTRSLGWRGGGCGPQGTVGRPLGEHDRRRHRLAVWHRHHSHGTAGHIVLPEYALCPGSQDDCRRPAAGHSQRL